MPFTGQDDPNLPSNVQKLTDVQRKKWIATWNNTFKNCRSDSTGGGVGSIEKCEGVAFRIANGTIKKEVDVMEERKKEIPQEDNKKNFEELTPERYPVPVVIVDEQVRQGPYAGAQSFEELEEHRRAEEEELAVSQVSYETRILIENVMESDDDAASKPGKIRKIASGFQKRLAEVLANMAKALEPTGEKAVTKTEGGIQFRASDYAVMPDPEKPSTWKLRLAEDKSGNFTVTQVARAITAMQPSGFRGQRVQLEQGQKKQAISRIRSAIGKTDGNDDQKANLRRRLDAIKAVEVIECPNDPSHRLDPVKYVCLDCGEKIKQTKDPALFTITKDKDGNMRWIGIPSNKWRDRDDPPQIIEEAAHKEFTEYLNESKNYPVLLSWHTPGTRIGVADFADYSNGFLIMGGPIDRDRYAEAERLAEKCQNEEIGMSHGFVYTYSNKEKEIIGNYRTWEVSHLPLLQAANVWTDIDILNEEVKQMFSTEKRKYIVDLHGEETAVAIENKVADLEKDLISAGIEFKDVTGGDDEDPEEDTIKSLVESDGFKAMIAVVRETADGIKELRETIIPELAKRIDGVEDKSKENAEKTKKTADDLIAEAFTSKSTGFRPSKDGDPPSEEEKKEEDESSVKTPVDAGMVSGFFGNAKPDV